MISIDGFRPRSCVYLDPAAEKVNVPNLVVLRDRGTWADRVDRHLPHSHLSVAHDLVTGTRPATHGVVQSSWHEHMGPRKNPRSRARDALAGRSKGRLNHIPIVTSP